jgi:hypothetical protein
MGPFLFLLGERHRNTRQALDGFILIIIAGIVCLHIVPEAWRVAGWISLIFLGFGLVFPSLLEAVFSMALSRAHGFVVAVAAVGVVVHAAIDGIALIPLAEADGINQLAVGVIVHRLPVGMAIWWVVRPRFGNLAAVVTFLIVIGATGASYFLGAGLMGVVESVGLACFQSFVAGSLVHVALFGMSHDHGDHGEHTHTSRFESRAFQVGVLIGLVVVVLVPHLHTG